MTTPHIAASPGDFAPVVLLPGDPLRAKFIAEKFLASPRLVTSVRNMLGYTGTFEGRPVSVMGSGMGIPSISIYATELITHFGAKVLIRVGSCGAVLPDVKVRDIIVATGAGTDSKVNRSRFGGHDFAAIADFALARRAVESAERRKIPVKVGAIFSADLFYSPETHIFDLLAKHGILGVEMEAAGLYGVAAEHGARALTLLTVSDHIKSGEKLTPSERETSFSDMVQIALDVARQES